jgi:diguanylate cyclase (GGDEF)-like protein
MHWVDLSIDRARAGSGAAIMRSMLVVFAWLGSPGVMPSSLGLTASVLLAYLLLAGALQWLSFRGVGGQGRAMVAGVIDIALITFIVHRVGSVATMMVALYFFAALMNTLLVGRREGIVLAALGALSYDALLLVEMLGWLPYAPDARWVTQRPGGVEVAGAALMMPVMSLVLTSLVGTLVHQNRARESELLTANEKLQELTLRDPLTQLYNRRYLKQRLDSELARVRRGKPLAVVMIDLDRFKRVNDDTGHQRGDELLEELAHGLSRAIREADVVGRYGGDEFVVILPDTGGAQGEVAAARLVDAIREVGLRFDPDRPVTASVGLAIARLDDDAHGLLERADRASYQAKSQGGNRVALESMAPPFRTARKVLNEQA